MAINLQCACGKRLTAPDSATGKRGKCPKCGREFLISGAQSTTQQASAATPAMPDSGFRSVPVVTGAILGGLFAFVIRQAQSLDASDEVSMTLVGVGVFACLGAVAGYLWQARLPRITFSALQTGIRPYLASRLLGRFDRPKTMPDNEPIPRGFWFGTRIRRSRRRYVRHVRDPLGVIAGLCGTALGLIILSLSLFLLFMAASMTFYLLAWIAGFLPDARSPVGSDWQFNALWLLALPCSVLLALCGVLVVRIAGYGQITAYSTFFCDFDAGKVYAWTWYLGAYKGLEHGDLEEINRVGVIEREELQWSARGGTTTVYYAELFQDERPVLSVQRYSSLMVWRAKSLAKEIADVLNKPCNPNPTTLRFERGGASN